MKSLAWALAAVALVWPLDATGQTRVTGPRFEVTGGAGLQTSATVGTRSADLRGNNPMPQSFAIFTTDTGMSRSLLADVRIGLLASPRVMVEGRLGYSRPILETSVTSDAEGAASITVVERIDQYVIDAGVVIRLDELTFAGMVPYAAGGAGYLRQLHEGLTTIEQGHVYHLGGGLRRDLWSRDRRVLRAAGLRVDARAYYLSGGISLGDGSVTQGTITAGMFLRF